MDFVEPPQESKIRSLKEIMKGIPELRPEIIQGVLRKGETMNIIGPGKCGVSWMALNLALGAVTGDCWMGFDVAPGNVLFIDTETHMEMTSERIHRMASAMMLDRERYEEKLFPFKTSDRFNTLDAMESFIKSYQEKNIHMVVIDSLARALPYDFDENSNESVEALYKMLDRCAGSLGAAIVLVQCGKKKTTDTGAHARACDTLVRFFEHDDGKDFLVVDIKTRSFPAMGAFSVQRQFPIFIRK